MSSGTSAVKDVLAGYLAGRVPADRLAAAVAGAYYGEGGGKREGLRGVIEVLERGAPGSVELVRVDGGVGFDIKPGPRAFVAPDEAALRAAVEAALQDWGRGTGETGRVEAPPGLLDRLVRALRRLFG
jgi:hypothetical protein